MESQSKMKTMKEYEDILSQFKDAITSQFEKELIKVKFGKEKESGINLELNREKALKTINNFLSKSISRRRNTRQLSSPEKKRNKTLKSSELRILDNIKKNILGRKIKNKILQNRSKITSHFLNTVCSDSGYCLAFGKESTKINNFFEFFHTFNYVKKVRKINNGVNGNILLLEYEREKYKSNAIIKKNIKAMSDSVMYEYIVGRYFINHYYKIYPCFLQTYGYSMMNNDIIDQSIRNTNVLSSLNVMNLELIKIKPTSFEWSNSREILNSEIKIAISSACNEPTNLALIIENITNPRTLETIMSEEPYFIEHELIYVLFQIYYVLNELDNRFTHYDLHTSNILIYEPIPHGYIEFHYNYEGNEIIFNSRYIAKIIDYGRCFFKRDSNINSKNIYNLVCSLSECNRNISREGDNKCGKQIGFQWLREENFVSSSPVSTATHINASIPNRSHDLRLLKIVSKDLNDFYPEQKRLIEHQCGDLKRIFRRLMNKIVYDGKGTREKPSAVLEKSDSTRTVYDASNYLARLIHDNVFNNYSHNRHFKKIGILQIYGGNSEMKFTEIK